MKNYFYSPFITFTSLVVAFILFSNHPIKQSKEKYPSDWFFMQRAYPLGEIPLEKYYQAIEQAKQIKSLNRPASTNPWVLVGPTNIGGRISDIEMSATSFDTIYAGIAS